MGKKQSNNGVIKKLRQGENKKQTTTKENGNRGSNRNSGGEYVGIGAQQMSGRNEIKLYAEIAKNAHVCVELHIFRRFRM